MKELLKFMDQLARKKMPEKEQLELIRKQINEIIGEAQSGYL